MKRGAYYKTRTVNIRACTSSYVICVFVFVCICFRSAGDPSMHEPRTNQPKAAKQAADDHSPPMVAAGYLPGTRCTAQVIFSKAGDSQLVCIFRHTTRHEGHHHLYFSFPHRYHSLRGILRSLQPPGHTVPACRGGLTFSGERIPLQTQSAVTRPATQQ